MKILTSSTVMKKVHCFSQQLLEIEEAIESEEENTFSVILQR